MFVCTGICVPVSLLCCQDAASAASHEDVSSFGGGSDHVCVCTLMYVYVCVYGHMRTCITFVLSRCCIVRQLLVKMFHLLVGGVIMCTCVP